MWFNIYFVLAHWFEDSGVLVRRVWARWTILRTFSSLNLVENVYNFPSRIGYMN